MVNENSCCWSFALPDGYYVIAIAAEAMVNLCGYEGVLLFFVGMQGCGAMYLFDNYILEDVAFDDAENVYDIVSNYMEDDEHIQLAKATCDKKIYTITGDNWLMG